MSDPLGLIGSASNSGQIPTPGASRPQGNSNGADFKKMLMGNLQEVNAVQQDATRATEDLLTGRRNDLEGVILATEKADTAFKMLQAMRNQVMQAMDEIKQMRV
ncbi:MAG: flagellar hook-basal body complex protein FliE [Phycisphaerales bacterium]|nr:flagellar hook-basal body complex protein FliE [Phycisphaerales bacterium]